MLSASEIIDCKKKSTHPVAFNAKNFEPSGSLKETMQIQNSLSEIEDIISNEKIKKLGSLSQAVWLPVLQLAEVTHQVGSHWLRFGHRINKKLYIYPEEALYLLETGSLELNYNEVPLSVQRAYFVLLALGNGLSLEKYRVYSYLNAIGYKVIRHFTESSTKKYEELLKEQNLSIKDIKRKLNTNLSTENFKISKKLKLDDMKLSDAIDTTSNLKSVFEKIEFCEAFEENCESKLIFDYDLYLPTKKQMLTPDFRIIVHRSTDPMPDLNEIANLTKKYKDDIPIVNAIVFPDHTAFYMINPVNI